MYDERREFTQPRGGPAVRFTDTSPSPAHLAPRSSRSIDDADSFAVSSGVSSPASRTGSYFNSSVRAARQQSADIADQHASNVYGEPDTRGVQNRFSAVPFHPGKESDETLTHFSPVEEEKSSGKDDFGGSWKPASTFNLYHDQSLDHTANRDPMHQAPQSSKNVSEGHSGVGFFGHVKDTLARAMRDPDSISVSSSRAASQNTSRRNSWSSAGEDRLSEKNSDKLDNFERTQRSNAEVEETYLIDEGLRRRRHPQERTALGRELSQTSQGPQKPHKHMSYQERRKKEKHVIKYHAESMDVYHKFVLIFAKALLTFGSPSHRIEAQLNSLAKVFEMEAQFQHTPGVIQVSFGNPELKASETCLIKANVGLSLGRINAIHNIYRAVLHDDMYASDGVYQLRKFLTGPARYKPLLRYTLSFITCLLICGVAFGGSLNDMWVAGFMGLLVRIMQNIASKSDLSASGSEVFTAALVSFIARAFASVTSQIWCFSAISSAGVISLLPGYLILSGSLDIAGKNQSLGAPKVVSGIMTSLYLGFGLTLGSDLFLFLDRPARRAVRASASSLASNAVISGTYEAFNSTSSGFGNSGSATFSGYFTFQNSSTPAPPTLVQGCFRDPHWGWYLKPMPFWTLFFLVPLFAFCSSMNNQQHWWSRQMAVMVTIACISFWITRVCNLTLGLSNHPDYVSLIGSWLLGILGNGYSRRFGGTAFTAMLTGILLLVPDGLSAAGGLAQTYQGQGQDEYTQSLTLARKMISVIIGILTGVYSSAALIYLFGKKKNAALVTF
ncbi:hypothetical protein EW145_g6037 [Phellinidium pouzarii]|uniref:Threonine/serine exporter-like N-terminal domain-containing protein n=1 Tax=Phellinidium pouzarii TaxID=167371 RepID=A0A4S4KZR6_9AGAM|nr:hypothetical protein EW145_g6037 [Phellinidium pouzarii]